MNGELPDVLAWIVANGYGIMLIGMLIEGPLVTGVAAFGAALGYFDSRIIFVLSALGDIIPDLIYFSAGYWGGARAVAAARRLFHASPETTDRIAAVIRKHAVKAIIFFKLMPLISPPGLIAAGAANVSPKKFLITDILFTIPNTLLFMALGFYFGKGFEAIAERIQKIQLLALLIIAAGTLVYLAYRKIFALFAGKISQNLDDHS